MLNSPKLRSLTGIIRGELRFCMKEAIHQALVLASEKATAKEKHGLAGIWFEVDKQSILDVEKLIK